MAVEPNDGGFLGGVESPIFFFSHWLPFHRDVIIGLRGRASPRRGARGLAIAGGFPRLLPLRRWELRRRRFFCPCWWWEISDIRYLDQWQASKSSIQLTYLPPPQPSSYKADLYSQFGVSEGVAMLSSGPGVQRHDVHFLFPWDENSTPLVEGTVVPA